MLLAQDERERFFKELSCDPSAEAVKVPTESEIAAKTLPSAPYPWGNPLVYPASVPGLQQTDPRLRNQFRRAGKVGLKDKEWEGELEKEREKEAEDNAFLFEERGRRKRTSSGDIGGRRLHDSRDFEVLEPTMRRPAQEVGRYDKPIKIKEDASLLPLTYTTWNKQPTASILDFDRTSLPTALPASPQKQRHKSPAELPTSGLRRRPDNTVTQLKKTPLSMDSGDLRSTASPYGGFSPTPSHEPLFSPAPPSSYPLFSSPGSSSTSSYSSEPLFSPSPIPSRGLAVPLGGSGGLTPVGGKTPLGSKLGGATPYTPGSESKPKAIFKQQPKSSSFLFG